MVCGRCGQPLGARVIPLKRRRRRPQRLQLGSRQRLWWLALLALLGAAGLLAALDGGERERPLPRDQRLPLAQPPFS